MADIHASHIRRWRAYATSIVLTIAALGLTGVTADLVGGSHAYFPFVAVLVVALHHGLAPGLLAVALSAAGLDFLYLGPVYRFGVANAEEANRLAAFVLTGVSVAWISARFRAARHDAETARRAAEAAGGEARQVGEMQERLVAVVSHDLRNPLGALRGNVDLLPRLGPLNDRQARAAASMRRTADRMEALIHDLLDVSRSRQGRLLAMTPSDVRVGDVCARAVAEIRDANPEAQVAVGVSGDDRAFVDPGRVAQVVTNLVANAIQHGAQGAPVRVSVRGKEAEVAIEVANQGAPIRDELRQHLFEPFRRGGGDGPGLGLGLFVVREVARAHGGHASFRSDGEGTVFEVALPRREIARVAAGRDRPDPGGLAVPG
ncbi:MAG TPA: ATP-binding protein [Anaeromyxobacteraceae bacterium]|nr:ATP-binding protein [Anaeromyxobacteraceae bacterium]